jgi:hypothetical protein
LTVLHHQVEPTASEKFTQYYNELNAHEQSMFSALERDVERARQVCRPLFGFIKRNGQIHFDIMPKNCSFAKEIMKSRHFPSELVLGQDDSVTLVQIRKLLGLVKLKHGVRINGIEADPYPTGDNDRVYFTYHIDLEAD